MGDAKPWKPAAGTAEEANVESGAKLGAAENSLLHVVEEVEHPVKHNPIVAFFLFLGSFMIPGLGMFCEAYFVFAVGNLSALWKQEYPLCWAKHQTCPLKLSDSITYTQVCGIIFGQIVLGFFADRIGRKWGSVSTAGTMVIGAILIIASKGPTERALWEMFTAVQFIFGIGVGGEYPVASTSANERAESSTKLQKRRGETVVLVFSMQGWGNLVNTAVIIAIMAGFHQYSKPYSTYALEVTWRLSYAIGLIPLIGIFLYRIFRLRESAVWQKKREALKAMGGDRAKGVQWRKFGLLMYYYWHRNFGTAMSWFVWDFAFYGNKLFQGTFIKIINPTASLIQVLEWTLLNSAVALVGYYFAAFTIDKPWMGRMRMQMLGFTWMFVLFLICAVHYNKLLANYIHAFQFMYYFSSFWGQFGPNATTWLLPAELSPTEVRSMCHGFSAAVGKAGALVAGVVFNLVDNRAKFWISAFCGLAGIILTFFTIPDITGLDLREGDRRWLAILDGHHDYYHGEAVNPRYLSVVERMLGYGRLYRPDGAADAGVMAYKVVKAAELTTQKVAETEAAK
ncbi:proton/phosphate symporter [Volvox carteri f. nagariensis]|uniref:Proton/phosphate symporter n=1 Tax=Volvox carteri f. nagariensis TaxID=3068 RepID=D8UA17_VOLCA|nr:proton/phosphate symporter [Volvox carteri f. nagariensis]EFJ43350.1 proton/phosphate symporter [Volvox carteri f. nagariensis]|eukprot:XP_002955497.1 proton/phosphate symporter [Volvox carteri f. nagariensis]